MTPAPESSRDLTMPRAELRTPLFDHRIDTRHRRPDQPVQLGFPLVDGGTTLRMPAWQARSYRISPTRSLPRNVAQNVARPDSYLHSFLSAPSLIGSIRLSFAILRNSVYTSQTLCASFSSKDNLSQRFSRELPIILGRRNDGAGRNYSCLEPQRR